MPRAKAQTQVVAVTVTRGVGSITAQVPFKQAFTVLVEMLDGMRAAVKAYPELLDAGPDTIPGSDPMTVVEDLYGGERRRRGVGYIRG